jgi:hypothetical protein
MEHKGGTKFYEGIAFEFNSKVVLVRRWGPNEVFKKKDSGPDVKIEVMVSGESPERAVSVVESEKTKAAKGYNRVTVKHGFHKAMTDAGYELEADEFLKALVEHYGPLRARQVQSYWADLEDIDLSQAVWSDPAMKTAPAPEPEPEVDRGEAWGVW